MIIEGLIVVRKLWAIEMGESGRPDLISDIHKIMGDGFEIDERGVLDDLSPEELEKILAGSNDKQIIGLTRDKRQLFLNSDRVEDRIRELVLSTKSSKEDVILVACDEEYSSISSDSFVFQPSTIFSGAVSSVLKGKRLVVVLPVEEQVERVGKKWKELSRDVNYVVVSPWDHDSLIEKMKFLDIRSLDAIVFDCFGFTTEHKQEIESLTGLPCFIPRQIVLGSMATLF